MKLLLINPRFRPSFWTFEWFYAKLFRQVRYPVAPLGLATIAALTPEHWDVEIVDENVEDIDWDHPADVVGVGGMSNQFARQREILEEFRKRGKYVVAGGNHASLLPEDYEGLADSVVAGEAERSWPEFCRDFEAGVPRARYQDGSDIDLAASPIPRFDLLKLDRYSLAPIQFSRGCPFRCEFCDIIVVFGRKPRTKSNEQIEAELEALRAQGARNVFFVDDNLIGHIPRAKSLLRALGEYQARRGHPFRFGSEVSMNVAQDPELLGLLRDARFGWLFTGIESPSDASLKETLKFQNMRMDLLEAVRTIHAAGIGVQAGFIVGFDADDASIFERQFRFIQDAGIHIPMVGLLIAIPRTPLWERLEKDGRLRWVAGSVEGALTDGVPADNTGPWTNFEPARMTYREMCEGYAELVRRLFTEKAIFERLRNHMDALKDPMDRILVPASEEAGFLRRVLWHGVLRGGPARWYFVVRSLRLTKGDPARLRAVLDFWGYSIALEAYVSRVFHPRNVARLLAEAEGGSRSGREARHA